MQSCSSNPFQRPLVRQCDECEDEVERLEDRYGFDGGIEVLGEEVEEDLGPEECFQCGSDLVWWMSISLLRCHGGGGRTECGGQDYEAAPVVLDQFAHAAAQAGR